MNVDALLGITQRLNVSVEALAALAAALRLRAEGLDPGPELRALIDDVCRVLEIDPQSLDDVTPEQAATIVGMTRAFFRQAEDLMNDPGRGPGWAYDDPVILQSQGRASMLVAPLVAGVAPQLGQLEDRLRAPDATFLDVGTGVGMLAVAMCQTFPTVRSVGIDIWTPALTLAAKNVADHGLGDRIELRDQSITDLDDDGTFDLVWVPAPFLPANVIDEALRRAHTALRPDGWAVLGLYTSSPDPLARVLTDLRIVRSGGHRWTDEDEAVARLEAAGYDDVQAIERTWPAPIAFIVGRRAT